MFSGNNLTANPCKAHISTPRAVKEPNRQHRLQPDPGLPNEDHVTFPISTPQFNAIRSRALAQYHGNRFYPHHQDNILHKHNHGNKVPTCSASLVDCSIVAFTPHDAHVHKPIVQTSHLSNRTHGLVDSRPRVYNSRSAETRSYQSTASQLQSALAGVSSLSLFNDKIREFYTYSTTPCQSETSSSSRVNNSASNLASSPSRVVNKSASNLASSPSRVVNKSASNLASSPSLVVNNSASNLTSSPSRVNNSASNLTTSVSKLSNQANFTSDITVSPCNPTSYFSHHNGCSKRGEARSSTHPTEIATRSSPTIRKEEYLCPVTINPSKTASPRLNCNHINRPVPQHRPAATSSQGASQSGLGASQNGSSAPETSPGAPETGPDAHKIEQHHNYQGFGSRMVVVDTGHQQTPYKHQCYSGYPQTHFNYRVRNVKPESFVPPPGPNSRVPIQRQVKDAQRQSESTSQKQPESVSQQDESEKRPSDNCRTESNNPSEPPANLDKLRSLPEPPANLAQPPSLPEPPRIAENSVTTQEFTSSATLNIGYSDTDLSSSSESESGSFTLEPVRCRAGGGLDLHPGHEYQVVRGVNRIRVLGRAITRGGGEEADRYCVREGGKEFFVEAGDIRTIRAKSGQQRRPGEEDEVECPNPGEEDRVECPNLCEDDDVPGISRAGSTRVLHARLPRSDDPQAGFWVEIPETSISEELGGSFSVVYEGKTFTVPKTSIAQIEVDKEMVAEVAERKPSSDGLIERKSSSNSQVKVFLGGEWQVFPAERVKESVRKPGSYVVMLTEKNVRVRKELIVFPEDCETADLPIARPTKLATTHPTKLATIQPAKLVITQPSPVGTKRPSPDSTEESCSSSGIRLDVSEYSVFLDGKFVRLSGRQVRPVPSRPGYYKVLYMGRKFVVHMNLVLPVMRGSGSGEVVVAPTHFRVLAEEGEYILPAEHVRPDPGAVNVFVVRRGAWQTARVKSNLMFPLWLNSDTMCVTDGTDENDLSDPRLILSRTPPKKTPKKDTPKKVTPPKVTLQKVSPSKPAATARSLTRSASFHHRPPNSCYYKVFREGKYLHLPSSRVEEVSSLTGFYKICLSSGEWVYHPAHCVSKVTRPLPAQSLRRSLSLGNLSWEESLRRSDGRREDKRPRWRGSFPSDESSVTKGGRLNKIRDMKRAENQCSEKGNGVGSQSSQEKQNQGDKHNSGDKQSEGDKLSQIDKCCTPSSSNNRRSNNLSGVTNSDLMCSVSLASR